MKKLVEYFNKFRVVSIMALTLFAVCSIIFVAQFSMRYASMNGTVYLSNLIGEHAETDFFSEKVQLFSAEYNNGAVKSRDGDNIIAPLTKNTYTLNINNNTGCKFCYSMTITAEIRNSPSDPDDPEKPLALPIRMTVTGPEGVCSFKNVEESKEKTCSTYHISEAGEVDTYRFDWNWETVSDEIDSIWGNAAAGDPEHAPEINICLEISTDTVRQVYVAEMSDTRRTGWVLCETENAQDVVKWVYDTAGSQGESE